MKNVLSLSTWIIGLSIIAVSIVLSVCSSSQLPQMMASHWNSSGEVNGYMSKFWGLYLMPLISLGILFLFAVVPLMDPLKKNFDSYRDVYNEFVLLLLLFFLYIHTASIVWNLGYVYDMSLAVIAAIGVLFFFIGRVLKKTKRNWFFGIRTPWTLSNDVVWEKTHALGSVLFQVSGTLMVLTIYILPTFVMHAVLVLVFGTVIALFAYSFILYKKIEPSHDQEV